MGDHRNIKRGRKEFRRLVDLNGGVDKFMKRPKERWAWRIATAILFALAMAEALAIWDIWR